jgi:hypothetical protein
MHKEMNCLDIAEVVLGIIKHHKVKSSFSFVLIKRTGQVSLKLDIHLHLGDAILKRLVTVAKSTHPNLGVVTLRNLQKSNQTSTYNHVTDIKVVHYAGLGHP